MNIVANITPEEFARFNGPFVVVKYDKETSDIDTSIEKSEIVMRSVFGLKGPINDDGTVSFDNLRGRISFVSPNYDPMERGVFSAFFDSTGRVRWILHNKADVLTDEIIKNSIPNNKIVTIEAHLTPEKFADFNGPFFVKNVYSWDVDADGSKVKNEKIVNRFCILLNGPMNDDGTVPPASQGDKIAFVSTSLIGQIINPAEVEFVVFYDEKGKLQWILREKSSETIDGNLRYTVYLDENNKQHSFFDYYDTIFDVESAAYYIDDDILKWIPDKSRDCIDYLQSEVNSLMHRQLDLIHQTINRLLDGDFYPILCLSDSFISYFEEIKNNNIQDRTIAVARYLFGYKDCLGRLVIPQKPYKPVLQTVPTTKTITYIKGGLFRFGEKKVIKKVVPRPEEDIKRERKQAKQLYEKQLQVYADASNKYELALSEYNSILYDRIQLVAQNESAILSRLLSSGFQNSEKFIQVDDHPQRGRSEDLLFESLMRIMPSSVRIDACSSGYYPDLTVVTSNGVNIDIEVDEPYEMATKKEIHYIGCSDEDRNAVLTSKQWIVVRFSEKQIITDCSSCTRIIEQLKQFVETGDISALENVLSLKNSMQDKRWTKEESRLMALSNYRNTY